MLIITFTRFLACAYAAGVLVHIEVQRRAAYILLLPKDDSTRSKHSLPITEYLNKYPDFAQSGSFFPDWGYGCLSSDDEAEMAHWPPFLGVAMNYVLETYPAINASTSAQQLLSFIHGFTAHQNTDATWHSIKFRDGFLRVMADIDFDGDYQAAHSILDIGGDAMLAKEFSMEQDGFDHLSKSWSVPLNDIQEIYKRLGVSVNSLKLRYCMARGFAAVSALRRVGSALTGRYQSKSPFMSTEVEQYHLGSIEEATTSTIPCWQSLESWITNKAVPYGNEIWDHCEPMKTVSRRGKAGPYRTETNSYQNAQHKSVACADESDLFQAYEEILEAEMEHIVLKENDGILTLSSTLKYPKWSDRKLVPIAKTAQAPYFLTPSVPYAEFGSSLAFVEQQYHGVVLAVGSPKDTDSSDAPARGGVYIIPISDANVMQSKHPIRSSRHSTRNLAPLDSTNVRDQKQFVLGGHHDKKDYNEHQSAYFGESVANLTLHGYPCLAILSFAKVEIFRTINGSVAVTPYVTIVDAGQSLVFDKKPLASRITTFKHKGESVLALLGPWTGPSSQGEVLIFKEQSLKSGQMSPKQADIRIIESFQSVEAYARFGAAMSYSEAENLFVVGVPGLRKVSGYGFDRHLTNAWKVFDLADPSAQTLETGFGSELLIVDHNLFVSSPTEDRHTQNQAGVLRAFKLLASRSSSTYKVIFEGIVEPQTPLPFAHFGTTLARANVAGGIYIASSTYDSRGAVFYLPSPVSGLTLLQRFVSIFGLPGPGNGTSGRDVTLTPCLLGYETNGKFGAQIIVSPNGLVAVSAPNAPGLGSDDRRAGKVYLYDQLDCT